MTDRNYRNGAYDDFLDAVEANRGYYYMCSNDHGLLPPRHVCPHCGDSELRRKTLPEIGTVVTHTTISVPTPRFADDTPYIIAIAEFGPVRLTGILYDDQVEIGQRVTLELESNETGAQRTIGFHCHS